jgi:hypothetical protein
VHGFVRDRNGRITTFDVPFPYLHGILDINDRGQTVGHYDTPSGPGGGFLREPDGEITPIDVPGAGAFTVGEEGAALRRDRPPTTIARGSTRSGTGPATPEHHAGTGRRSGCQHFGLVVVDRPGAEIELAAGGNKRDLVPAAAEPVR